MPLKSNNPGLLILPALLASFFFASCATYSGRTPHRGSGDSQALTIGQVLEWSLDGPAGVERAMRALERAAAPFEVLEGTDRSSRQMVTLADGTTLAAVSLQDRFGAFRVTAPSTPCVQVEPLADRIGAGAAWELIGAHGERHGWIRDVVRNGTRIELFSQSQSPACVVSVSVKSERGDRP